MRKVDTGKQMALILGKLYAMVVMTRGGFPAIARQHLRVVKRLMKAMKRDYPDRYVELLILATKESRRICG